MTTHPYISGPGNVEQMIGFLRKTFPATVNAETVKKFSLASNNESYVINALQFIGIIDEEGKRTLAGQQVMVLSGNDFSKAFGDLIRTAYKDLFEIRGDEAWTLPKAALTNYFRTSDKTSDVIGSRQAGLFQVFARLSGYEATSVSGVGSLIAAKPKPGKPKLASLKVPKAVQVKENTSTDSDKLGRREMAMTVRIEINLPANGSQETYDNIFKRIRANLIDE